jgi:hypothetical protein
MLAMAFRILKFKAFAAHACLFDAGFSMDAIFLRRRAISLWCVPVERPFASLLDSCSGG